MNNRNIMMKKLENIGNRDDEGKKKKTPDAQDGKRMTGVVQRVYVPMCNAEQVLYRKTCC